MKPQNVQAVVVATLSKLREDALRNVLRSERTSTSQDTSHVNNALRGAKLIPDV